jgi:phosphatidylglycerophosphatase A
MLWLTVMGLGHLRPAPGTWGSLPPCAFAAALAVAHLEFSFYWYAALLTLLIAFSLACLRLGQHAETLLGKKDPSAVVADETAGMALTLLFLPWAGALAHPPAWLGLLVPGLLTDWLGEQQCWMLAQIAMAFLLFRIFDILKLPPARGLQRLRAGTGILIDDLIAGAQAGLLTLGLLWALTQV